MEQGQGDSMSSILDKLTEAAMYIVLIAAMWAMGDHL